jgi:putative membrane protein
MPSRRLGSIAAVWDTQADMFCALIGAAAALLPLSSALDRALARVGSLPTRTSLE